jgi:hypothetical protein
VIDFTKWLHTCTGSCAVLSRVYTLVARSNTAITFQMTQEMAFADA